MMVLCRIEMSDGNKVEVSLPEEYQKSTRGRLKKEDHEKLLSFLRYEIKKRGLDPNMANFAARKIIRKKRCIPVDDYTDEDFESGGRFWDGWDIPCEGINDL
jgi:hypothetical protein